MIFPWFIVSVTSGTLNTLHLTLVLFFFPFLSPQVLSEGTVYSSLDANQGLETTNILGAETTPTKLDKTTHSASSMNKKQITDQYAIVLRHWTVNIYIYVHVYISIMLLYHNSNPNNNSHLQLLPQGSFTGSLGLHLHRSLCWYSTGYLPTPSSGQLFR